jgi:transposase
MDVLLTLPVAETAPQSTEALPAPADPSRGLRLRCANRAVVCPVPVRLENLLPPEHPARQIWELVKGLDLSEFYADIQVDAGTPDAPATDPLILIALWVYATRQGETCARTVADLCVHHLAYLWLCGGVSMNYHPLSDFRTQSESVAEYAIPAAV